MKILRVDMATGTITNEDTEPGFTDAPQQFSPARIEQRRSDLADPKPVAQASVTMRQP